MEFRLQRRKGDGCTLGTLTTGAGWQWKTLELASPIPAGRYRLVFTLSGRAQRGTLWTPDKQFRLPELLEVPGHTAIRMHAGNSVADTEGCILLGGEILRDKILSASRTALTAFVNLLEPALKNENCWIAIIDPVEG